MVVVPTAMMRFPSCFRGVDGFGGGRREGVVLGVEVDVFQIFDSDGLEGAEAYVEGYGFDLYPFLFQLVEDFGGEVEAGGGGGGAAGLLGKNCLVAVAIFSGCRRDGCRVGAACGLFC